jgi:multiple sugar transport system ATP-binding protein
VRQALDKSNTGGGIILCIRPEHFEDAALVLDKPGDTFDAPVDIVEAMGSDVYAYFMMKGEEAHSDQLDALAKDAGNDLHADGIPITARLDAGSHVKRGEKARLWYDTSKVQIFDAASGANLVPGDKD